MLLINDVECIIKYYHIHTTQEYEREHAVRLRCVTRSTCRSCSGFRVAAALLPLPYGLGSARRNRRLGLRASK